MSSATDDRLAGRVTASDDEHGGDLAAHPGVRLDFSVNVNPLGVPAPVVEAISAGLGGIQHYPDPRCRALRRALAVYHGVSPRQIVCGNGAADLIYRVVAATRPRRVLTFAPTFSEYERSARSCGAEVVRHQLAAPLFDVTAAALDAITGGTDLVFCCQPNNPTGRLIDPGLLIDLIEATRKVGARLVVDECFLPFTQAASLIPGLPPHVVVIRAFTKTHGLAGLRLGYAVCGSEALARALAETGPSWNVSSLAQTAGLAALKLPDWDEQTRAVTDRERGWLAGELTALGLAVVPSQANFLLFRSPVDLFAPLLARGVLIRSGANFAGLDGSWFRVGLHQHADNAVLVAMLTEVLNGC